MKKKKAKPARPEQIVLPPAERREAIMQVIRGARESLLISLFRCTDKALLAELYAACRRKIRVRALVTPRAKGGKVRLEELGGMLESLGAEVHRYPDHVVKYHAKYLVADSGPAMVASLNFTKKCFSRTSDFLHFTYDPEVVSGLSRLFESDCHGIQALLPKNLSDRLIVGPDRARSQLADHLQQAKRSIWIVDKKLDDADMLALLAAKKAQGVEVRILGAQRFGDLVSHGKLFLVDGATAVIGSISLSTLSLEFRRELALKIQDPRSVRRLARYCEYLAACQSAAEKHLNGDDADEEDEEEGLSMEGS